MKLRLLIISFAMVMSGLLLPLAVTTPASAIARDCDDNAVVHCGTLTLGELRENYKGDVKASYAHFGITSSMISSTSRIKDGYVTKSGDVLIGDKVVATDALTAGRQDMPGSTPFTAGGTTFYQRPPSVSFGSDKLEAFVFVDENGAFVGAVIKSCGNPVKATAKKQPAAACTSVTVNKISRTEYTFTVKANIENGAKVLGYSFKLTGPQTVTIEPVKSVSDTYTTKTVTITEPGSYKIVATVATSQGDKTSDDCAATFTVDEEPKNPDEPKNPGEPKEPKQIEVCDPETGEIITVDESEADKYKPADDDACKPKEETKNLPSTGPGDMIVAAGGLGGLTAAGYYFRSSRQRIRDALLK